MPTYQYRCTECGHDLEAVQKFSDASLTVCPSCGGSLRKIFNAVGVVFKGSGFYRTDSRDAGKSGGGSESGSPEKSSDSGSKESAGSSPAKTDSAPSESSKPAAAKTDSGSSSPSPAASSTATKSAAK